MTTFIRHKDYQIWLWLALCPHSRKVLAYYLGDRSSTAAGRLWKRLPLPVRQQAVFHTDRYQAYLSVIPPQRHLAKGKATNHVERLNNTLRQRVAPLVRRTLGSGLT